jgi:hypothetical protein
MTTSPVRAMPVTYRGTQFRSTLEAHWAATFDAWAWHSEWMYEPVALTFDGISYLCDFYLPNQRVWCEVKGPHNERLDKVHALAREIERDDWTPATELIVVLRPPGPGDLAMWESASPNQDVVLVQCPEPGGCGYLGFMDLAADWSCRRCHQRKPWVLDGGAYYLAGQIDFWRAA